jgi:hypothetical protein
MRKITLAILPFSALTLGAAAANAATPVNSGAFCLTPTKAGDSKNCSFATMAACEKGKSGSGDTCAPNAGTETTGSGLSMSPAVKDAVKANSDAAINKPGNGSEPNPSNGK